MKTRSRRLRHLLLIIAGVFLSFRVGAQSIPTERGVWHERVIADGTLTPAEWVVPIEDRSLSLPPAIRSAWTAFAGAPGKAWSAHADRRTGAVAAAEGRGIPWIPGGGNRLALGDLAPLGVTRIDLDGLDVLGRRFLAAHGGVFGVAPGALRLRRESSGQPAPYLWFLDYVPTFGGLPVEGARVVLRVNHGNLVQFGSERMPQAGVRVPPFAIDRETAWARLTAYLGGTMPGDQWIDPGSRHLLVSAPPEGAYGIAAIWQFVLRRPGRRGTFRARVDAETGAVREFLDSNQYAHATAGVYRADRPDPETVLPLPYADLSTGGFTNSAGNFAAAAGATSTLNGQYVFVFDTCGAISLASDGNGNLVFGGSGGTDCTTPGIGGAGNTHGARSVYYDMNRIAEVGRGWLPGNSWLQTQLRANVNLQQTCDAYWDGAAVNFFRSGGGCADSGELPGISVHEYGHGLDQNDGNGFSPDSGTAETVGDFTSVLFTHRSCIGSGFRAGNCTGYGDACTACTGVRDVDYFHHAFGAPHTVDNFTKTFCPNDLSNVGPCGSTFPIGADGRREGHCESYVSSEALWDLAARDLPGGGTSAAWAVADRLWYLSRATSTAAFQCNTGGTVATFWSSNGCNIGSLFHTFRAVDDDDGNLGNGTPHGGALAAALGRHSLACATDTGWNVTHAACTPPSAPALTLTPRSNRVDLSWSSGGVGTVFDVYRNESGCDTGFTKIADDLAAPGYTDTANANGVAYFYQVTAHPAGDESCSSAPSACQTTTPVPPGAPALAPLGAPAAHQVQLSWANGVPAAPSFRVERKLAPCAGGGAFAGIASGVVATSFLDTAAPGGVVVSYRVVGTDGTGFDESPPSNCREVTPLGTCDAPPSFAGVVTATDLHLARCTVGLAWNPAASVCGGGVTYNVYRGAPGFTPAPANLIATGLSGTGYADGSALAYSAPYEYVVRAVDGGNGVEDQNVIRRARAPSGPMQTVTLNDSFEGAQSGGGFDLAGWEHQSLAGGSDWASSTAHSASPTHAQFAADPDATGDRVLVSPPFAVQASTTLHFAHTFGFDFGAATCFDGGTLESTTDGGLTWNVLPDAAFTGGGFNGTVYRFWNPLGGKRAWCAGSVGMFTSVDASLASLAGNEAVRLRWHAGSDNARSGVGWYVDSVSIGNALIATACGSTAFYTLAPCRVLDTRNPAGPGGGPAIPAGGERSLVLSGACGIPPNAVAVSVNVTIAGASAPGNLVLYPADLVTAPNTSNLSFGSGTTRANNAILQLNPSGVARVKNLSAAAANVIVDVNGYFQ